MSDAVISPNRVGATRTLNTQLAERVAWTGLILFAVLWNQAFGWLNPDTSWLIHAAHRVLDGEGLHVDVWDTNPPFSVLLYIPMAWMENLTGIRAEIWTTLALFGSFGASFWLCSVLLRLADEHGAKERFAILYIVAAITLLIMPNEYAQREQFGIILALPLLMTYAFRPSLKGRVPLWVSCLTGAFAAVLLMIKPFYAVAFLLPVIWRLAVDRDWKLLFIPAHFVGAAFVLTYGASVLVYFQPYLQDVMPLVVEFYLPARPGLFFILELTTTILLPGIIAAFIIGRISDVRAQGTVAFTLAAIGFWLALYVSGKGFAYHFLPSLISVFVIVALRAAPVLVSADHRASTRRIVAGLVVLSAALTLLRLDVYTYRKMPVPEAVRAMTPNVRMATFGPDLAVGNPMARRLGAEWTDREPSDLLTALVKAYIDMDRDTPDGRLQAILDADLQRKADYITETDVNFILLDHTSLQWSRFIMKQPVFLESMAGFRSIGCYSGASYLIKDGSTPGFVPDADWGKELENECAEAGEIDLSVAD